MNDQLSTLDDFARHSAIPRKVLLYLHRQHRKRQNSRICFSLSLPVIVGHLFLWRPLL